MNLPRKVSKGSNCYSRGVHTSIFKEAYSHLYAVEIVISVSDSSYMPTIHYEVRNLYIRLVRLGYRLGLVQYGIMG